MNLPSTNLKGLLLALALVCLTTGLQAKKKKTETTAQDTMINSTLVSGLQLRNIGPAFTSGRIADFAVNPDNHSEYYVAVASGNIWKTTNNGITFDPVFENYGAYSIGCLAMDPTNPHVIWAGTGENNHQRALAYGDGVYKSVDGGKSWTNMGLKESRHIGMILIDPRNANVVYVAAEGSTWGPGGDRGLYKTTDGGTTWEKILEISENTGINNIICDPRNPDILYATSEQRRRHVHTKIGGGPETAIYKSEDAGKNWRKLTKGLPTEHMGGIGIAISPQKPDVIYAIIEAANKAGGFFRSSDRGESWDKMSDHHSSGQYYNEIYCDPVTFDKVYSVETFTHVTTDGGKTFQKLSVEDRHVDDHALWIDPNDNKHLIIGGDGGVYITYDAGENWQHVSNLPVTQFYRVTVDNAEPFYNVYGGTQDNATLGGPSRNINTFGVKGGEWVVTVFGDGFWPRVDPTNPDIVYSEWQYGNVVRYDKKSGERIMIKPLPRKDEKTYRWNWNTPLIISPHSHTRLYMAANKVFRSDDRGNTWQVISNDLTAQIDRNTWPVMGKYWSTDAVAKDVSTSQFGTIVSLDESPVKEDLIYAGTDDGLIQVSEDAGQSWHKVSNFPGVPTHTYVSDIYASRFDENVVYATFDNRKRDDFTPYILKSNDKGHTWTSIASNLPDNGTVHTLEQDFEKADLLFAGTEFGVFFSINEGASWVQLKSGIPTIAVRDLALQPRENDLVMATFGRGFYILDNYAPLRELTPDLPEQPSHLFATKDALLYIPTGKRYGQGATYYGAPNPEYGATFTFFLKEVPKTRREARHEMEKKLFEESQPIPQPSWTELEDETKEIPPYLLVTMRDEEGSIIRTMTQKPTQGINRFNWDLKYDDPRLETAKTFDPFAKKEGGIYVLPGTFSVSIDMIHNEEATRLADASSFKVKPLHNTTLPATNRQAMVAFQKEVTQLAKTMNGAMQLSKDLKAEVIRMKQTALTLPGAHSELMPQITALEKELDDILFAFNGSTPKASWEEIPPAQMPLYVRLESVIWAHIESTSDITATENTSFQILKEAFPPVLTQITNIAQTKIKTLRALMDQMDAPYTPGRIPQWP
ncbi:glycosyl hydrolase [Marinilabiliaceae bacterium JC017]|nr:glycosyl hydrolase [Marinilabiliaceae bacterium JC017]